MRAEKHTITIDDVPIFYRSAPASGGDVTPVFLHTAPTSSDDWVGALKVTGGLAPDLIGFGRSAKGGHLDYSPLGISRFVEALLDTLAVPHVDLVAHGWGAAVAVALARRRPERVRRLVFIDAAPALGEARWHRLASLWRRPLVGELLMGAINRPLLARWLRGASASPQTWPDERVEAVWEQFDQGTQRATLRLHRWATPDHVQALAQELRRLERPALILWGERDSWFPPSLAGDWAAAAGASGFGRIEGAGHWPWLDRPEVLERIAGFLADR